MNIFSRINCAIIIIVFYSLFTPLYSQSSGRARSPEIKVRTVTIPITIFSKQEIKENQTEEFIEAGHLIVKEDNEEQVILSIKSVSQTPMALAILIQENLSGTFNLELRKLSEFIRRLPRGSRVMVAYLRSGSIQIRQKFTDDLEKVANSLRIVSSSSAAAPNNPYSGVREALDRFDSLPSGRRAILLVSDGLDITEPSPIQSFDLDRAILNAQRKSVAIYSFYTSTNLTENSDRNLSFLGQGALNRLSEETGGRSFYQGSISPVSFDPFFKDLSVALNRQFALTYLSTHMKKGYYKVQVYSTNPDIKIEHPKGYVFR